MDSSISELSHLLLESGSQSKINNRMANGTDADETARHLDLHCLQRYYIGLHG